MVHERLTVKQAAQTLGISQDAVRKRVARGTLASEKLPDGTVLVWLDADQDADEDNGFHPTQAHLDSLEKYIARLEAELEDRKEEARRKDAIIMTLAQRVPELQAPQEKPRESPVPRSNETTPTETAGGSQEGTEEPTGQRSWWRRLLEG